MNLSEYQSDLYINHHVSAINEFPHFEISNNHKTALQILSRWSQRL